MPSIVDLGKLVKQKYPGSYDDVPDAELGLMVKEAHPGAYDDFTDAGGFQSLVPRRRGLLETGREAVRSFFPSLGRLARDIGSAAVNVFNQNPEENTIVNLGRTAAGALESIPGVEQGLRKIGPVDETVAEENRARFRALIDYFRDRYGGTEQAKETFAKDPAGFLLDLSTVVSGAGAATRAAGTAAKASRVAGAGRVIQAAGEAVSPAAQAGRGAGAGLRSAKVAPFAKEFDPAAARVAAGRGIDAPLSTVTGSRFVQGLEGLLSKGPFGGRIFRRLEKSAEDIRRQASQIAQSVTPKTDLTKPQLGQLVKERFDLYEQRFHSLVDSMYEDFMPQIGREAAVTSATVRTLRQVIVRRSKVLGGDPSLRYYQRMLDELDPTAQLKARGVSEDFLKKNQAAAPKATIEQLHATKAKVGRDWAAHGGQDPDLGTLYDAMRDDMLKSATRVDPEFGRALQRATDEYRAGKQIIQEGIGRSIRQLMPEDIANRLVLPSKPTYLKQLRTVLGEDQFQHVSAALLSHIVERSSNVVRIPGPIPNTVQEIAMLDPRKFLKILSQYSDESLRAALSPEQYAKLTDAVKNIKEIDTLNEALKRGRSISEGSQTAFLSNIAALVHGVGAGLGYAVAGKLGVVLGILGSILGQFGLSRFIQSPAGYRFFTTGFRPFERAGKAIETVTRPGATAPAVIDRATKERER